MNLSGAVVEYLNSLLRFYRKLEERFEENSIIQKFWRDMADDTSLQIQNLKSLQTSVWNQFKNAPDNSFESAFKAVKEVSAPPADVSDISLRDCFEISLRLTEPVVLKIYARLVRLQRKSAAATTLNFYIPVKAYVARLVRITESFAGDPMLIRRAQLLLVGLDKEVQEPVQEIRVPAANVLSAKTQKASVSGKVGVKTAKETKVGVKTAKATTKTPHGNIKTTAPKPVKAVPVKTKTPPGKTPATTKRA